VFCGLLTEIKPESFSAHLPWRTVPGKPAQMPVILLGFTSTSFQHSLNSVGLELKSGKQFYRIPALNSHTNLY
jgi:hypothetical protein